MNRTKLAVAAISGGLISIISNEILSPFINLWLEKFIGDIFWREFSSYLVSLFIVILIVVILFWGLMMFGVFKRRKE